MTAEESYKITSNDFADLIIDYNYDIEILSSYPNASYNIIDQRFAVLYIPVSEMTYNAVYKFGYASIPKCYGMMNTFVQEPGNNYYIPNLSDEKYTGRGVLVGVVDSGIDYRNMVFQYPDNTTRIAAIWDQTVESNDRYPKEFYYGTEYNRDQINLALRSQDPYSIVPSNDNIGQGTAMAGIAAGFYYGRFRFLGTAPDAELVVVKLKPAKPYLKEFFGIPEDALCYEESDIMMGIKYLVQTAVNMQRPIVICLGLGSSQGSHMGGDFISKYISDIGRSSGVAVIIGAGEEGNQRGHYYGEISSPDYYHTVELNIGAGNENFSMELWGYPPNLLGVDIIAPGDNLVYHLPRTYKQLDTISVFYNETAILIDNRLQESFAGSQLVLFRFKNISEGIWKFRISGSWDLLNRFHMWLPINQFISSGTYFINSNTYTTISVPGNTINLVTVSAYNPVDGELYHYASRGFTKTNEPKPNIAAPGVNIVAPAVNNNFAYFTGTSLSAAYTAGIAARLMEWGVINGNLPNMDCAFIRYIMTGSANRSSTLYYPNPDWGFGVLEENLFGDIL